MVVIENGSYIQLEHLPRHLIECYTQQQQDDCINNNDNDDDNDLTVLEADFYKPGYKNKRKKSNNILKHKKNSIERDLIIKILGETKGNVSRSARILGISRQSLQYRLNKYNINRTDFTIT